MRPARPPRIWPRPSTTAPATTIPRLLRAPVPESVRLRPARHHRCRRGSSGCLPPIPNRSVFRRLPLLPRRTGRPTSSPSPTPLLFPDPTGTCHGPSQGDESRVFVLPLIGGARKPDEPTTGSCPSAHPERTRFSPVRRLPSSAGPPIGSRGKRTSHECQKLFLSPGGSGRHRHAHPSPVRMDIFAPRRARADRRDGRAYARAGRVHARVSVHAHVDGGEPRRHERADHGKHPGPVHGGAPRHDHEHAHGGVHVCAQRRGHPHGHGELGRQRDEPPDPHGDGFRRRVVRARRCKSRRAHRTQGPGVHKGSPERGGVAASWARPNGRA